MKILITGISGQDGIFLTKVIKNSYPNFSILGTSRSMDVNNFLSKSKTNNLSKNQYINIVDVDLENPDEVDSLLKDLIPDYIYNLTGPSSVNKSLKNPELEFTITNIFNNLTNAAIKNQIFCNFYQASTSEMYGLNNKQKLYNENSEFIPNSPYASGKLTNHKKVKYLRDKYSWNIFSGIMFNHESEYRKNDFLFMKIIKAAHKIKNGSKDKLTIGSLDYCRDWSYAEDIAEGIFSITTAGSDYDYVLGSGTGTSIKNLVDIIFKFFDLDYKEYVEVDKNILRKNDPQTIISDPTKIYKELGWKTTHNLEDLIEKTIKNVLSNLR